MTHHVKTQTAASQTVRLVSTYRATPRTIWSAWVDIDKLTQWWGCAPNMLWNVHTWQVRVDGPIHVSMDFDGKPFEVRGRFVDVIEAERLRFTWEEGQIITITIEPQGDSTRMSVEHSGIAESHQGIVAAGWSASHEQLCSTLEQP